MGPRKALKEDVQWLFSRDPEEAGRTATYFRVQAGIMAVGAIAALIWDVLAAFLLAIAAVGLFGTSLYFSRKAR